MPSRRSASAAAIRSCICPSRSESFAIFPYQQVIHRVSRRDDQLSTDPCEKISLTLYSRFSRVLGLDQVGLDEVVEVAVEDRVHVSHLQIGAVIGHQPIGRQDIRADLRAPLDG